MHNDETDPLEKQADDGAGAAPTGGEKPGLRKKIEDWLYPAAAVYTLGDAPEKVVVILEKLIQGLGTYLGLMTKDMTAVEQAPWLLGELGQIPELVVDLRVELLKAADTLPDDGPEFDELVEAILATCVPNGGNRLRIRSDMARAAVRNWAMQRRLPPADPEAPPRPRP